MLEDRLLFSAGPLPVAVDGPLGDLTDPGDAAADVLGALAPGSGEPSSPSAVEAGAASTAGNLAPLATETFFDDFQTGDYTGDWGSDSWSGDWIESDSGGGAPAETQGNIDVFNNALRLSSGAAGDAILREVDLSRATTATLTFDYSNSLVGLQSVSLQVSDDGGGSFTTEETFSLLSNIGVGSATVNLDAYLAADTQIQFVFTTSDLGGNLAIDNVEIAYAVPDAPGGVETDLTLWMKADSGVTIGSGGVRQWDNLVTGSSLPDVRQGSSLERPDLIVNAVNGNPVFAFDGFNDNLRDSTVAGSDLFNSDSGSIFTVARVTAPGVILQWEENTNNRVSTEIGGGALRFDFGDDVPPDRLSVPEPAVAYHIFHAEADPSGAVPNLQLFVDGQLMGQNGASSANPLNPAPNGQFVLGEWAGGSVAAEMELAEAIIYRTELDAADAQQVASYLAVKYGITLDQTSPTDYLNSAGDVVFNGTTRAAYNNDIAAIGRDARSTLVQTASRSINADSVVTVSGAADLQDREFLFWGNDDGALTETAAGSPAGVAQRFTRMWQATETGEVGTTTVEFDVSGLGVVGNAASDFRLIVDNDGDLTSGATLYTAASFVGGQVVFNGVDLDDGQLFTLGTGFNTAPTLSDTVVTLNNVAEDAPAPTGAVGTLIDALVDLNPPAGGRDNVTDPDTGAVTGIAITAADATNGLWHYSTDNGSSWNSLGAVANNNARLLAADGATRIYFEPNDDYNGNLPAAITFHAWDQYGGVNGGLADASATGGATSFSTATDTAALDVTPQNDPPTAVAIPNVSVSNKAPDMTIDLATYFDDVEDGAAGLTYAVVGNDDPAKVATSLSGSLLTLSFSSVGIANIDLRATDMGDNGDPAQSVLASMQVHVNPAAHLLLSTVGDVSGAATSGLQEWEQGDAIGFGPTAISLGGATSGKFTSFFSLASFGVTADIDALHYVSTDITVGGGGSTYDLLEGDLLFSISTNDPATTVSIGDETVHDRDVVVFRPVAANNYGAGNFDILLDDLPKLGGGDADEVTAISLVELDTVIGDATVLAGDFLYATKDSDKDILLYSPTSVGRGATAGSPRLLVDGGEINISPPIDGLHLISVDSTLGGLSLTSGQILVSIESSDSVGDNNIFIRDEDIFALTVSQTALPPGAATSATASRFFDGSDVGLNGSASRNVDAFTLPPLAPLATPPTIDLDPNNSSGATGGDYQTTYVEGAAPVNIADVDVNLVDPDSAAFNKVRLVFSKLIDGADERMLLDGTNFSLAAAVSNQTTLGLNYETTITLGAGIADVVVAKAGGGAFTEAEVENLLRSVQYVHQNADAPSDGDRFVDVIVPDEASDSATVRATIDVQPVNDQPAISGWDNLPVYTEGSSPVVLDGDATLADVELDAIDNYNGATLRLVRSGGANGNDRFSATGALSPLVEGDPLVVGGTTIGTVATNSGGVLQLAFTNNATAALVDSVVQQIAYSNASPTPTANIGLELTVNDGNAGAQGTGGPQQEAATISVVNVAVDTPPLVDLDANNSSGATGADYQTTYREGDVSASLADIDAAFSDADSNSFPTVRFVATGLLDGNDETLLLDGSQLALATPVVGQVTAGGQYSVTIVAGAGTADVLVTNAGGGNFTQGQVTTLLRSIGYRHFDDVAPSDGDRQVVVTVSDGFSSSLPARATINVAPVNDLPTFSSFAGAVAGSLEDTTVEITFADLAGQSDAADVDGTVTAYVVRAVASGTLRIGPTAALATPYIPGANDVIDAANRAYWTPPDNAHGALNAMRVVARDNDLGVSTRSATAWVDVASVNDWPIAVADRTTVVADSALKVSPPGVLSNDIDVDGDVLSANLVTGPTNGTLVLSASGGLIYRPNKGFTGVDTFTYTATDGVLTSGPATVTVTVLPAAVAPPPTTPPAVDPPPPSPPAEDPPPEEPVDESPPPIAPPTVDGGPSVEGLPPAAPPLAPTPDPEPVDASPATTYEAVVVADALRGGAEPLEQREVDPNTQLVLTNTFDFSFAADTSSLWGDLDRLVEQMDADARAPEYAIGAAAGFTGTISVGYVVWLVRGGHLLAGLLAQLPAWQLIDPLPILSELDDADEDDEEDDSLEALVGDEAAADPRPTEEFNARQTSVADSSEIEEGQS